jgi:hypothetical protein
MSEQSEPVAEGEEPVAEGEEVVAEDEEVVEAPEGASPPLEDAPVQGHMEVPTIGGQPGTQAGDDDRLATPPPVEQPPPAEEVPPLEEVPPAEGEVTSAEDQS